MIESLGYNFIQLYTNIKKGRMVTEAFWPAKLHGNVKLKTKGSAADPKKGKLSVEISPGKEKANIPIGSSTVDEPEPKATKVEPCRRPRVAGAVERLGEHQPIAEEHEYGAHGLEAIDRERRDREGTGFP